MSKVDMQALVNAQVEINSALFIANARNNRHQYEGIMTDEDLSEEKIIRYAVAARECLDKALAEA
jgi:hypothetical protein